MVSSVNTFGIVGARAFQVTVEADIARGIPYFDVVGLGNEAVKESKKRVRAAILNQGYQFPPGRITLNLAPAGTRKQGTYLDLAIAVGILCSAGVVKSSSVRDFAFVGELSLNGEVRPVKGVLPMVVLGAKQGIKNFIVPFDNGGEAFCGRNSMEDISVFPVKSLKEAVEVIGGKGISTDIIAPIGEKEMLSFCEPVDFSDVVGQSAAKRALEIAAAGYHNVLMMGSAGCGKTMMAKAIRGIMKPLSFEEAFEVSQIYSVAGVDAGGDGLIRERPFRSVHCGVTRAALVGGGRPLELGEISLAHNGILFMDELSEVGRLSVEALRQPLEERFIRITNCGVKEILPANFMLIGASNPCPCGNLYEASGKCTCSPAQIRSHAQRISAPIMDRIDIHIPVRKISAGGINDSGGETSSAIRERVIKAASIQEERYKNESFSANGMLTRNSLLKYCHLDKASKTLLERAVENMGLSMRAYEKVVKVSRTIADLAGRESIICDDVAEALQYRCFDRQEVSV